MKRRFFALALASLLLTTAPAYAQRVDGAAIQFGGITIPVDQAKPPAGVPHVAFRPSCDQLTNRMNPETGLVEWGVSMPDGYWQKLYELEPIPLVEAHQELGSAGACKFGTADDGVVQVPLIYSDQVPKTGVAIPDAVPVSYSQGVVNTSNSPTAGMPLWLTVLCGVAFGIGSIAAYQLTKRHYEAQPTSTVNPDGGHDPFEEI